ncbi:uncharacterized protein LOC134671622 [Cydia fagiglandana]|uniref:uncharacterized protein LOC134671622 n=1 Tax=Cydia fagiglandana TaxID=1458189 RepID=UPI002FEDFC55
MNSQVSEYRLPTPPIQTTMTRALFVVAVLAALALVQVRSSLPPPPPPDQSGHHLRTPDYPMRLIDDYRRDNERFDNHRRTPDYPMRLIDDYRHNNERFGRRGWGTLKQMFRSSKHDLDEFDSDSSFNANDR